jgi:hypothetical protein
MIVASLLELADTNEVTGRHSTSVPASIYGYGSKLLRNYALSVAIRSNASSMRKYAGQCATRLIVLSQILCFTLYTGEAI